MHWINENGSIKWQDPGAVREQADGLSALDIMRGIRDGRLPPPPIARLIGFRYIEAEPGQTAIELQPEQSLENTSGTLHGAAAGAMLDTAMCAAAVSSEHEGPVPPAALEERAARQHQPDLVGTE